MLRLRTTTGLSVLALAIGIAGTGWLSTLTGSWRGGAHRHVALTRPAVTHRHTREPRHEDRPVSVVMRHRHAAPASPVGMLADARAATIEPPATLVPLATPSDNSQPWYRLKGHLDGQVLVHLTVDGSGRVITAVMRESSGDPILDDHALRSVQRWRFAVPADHAHGLSGDLPMRFASGGDDVARVM